MTRSSSIKARRIVPVLAAIVAVLMLFAAPAVVRASQVAISPTAQGAVSGGGTVNTPGGDASFGLNSVRPSTFPSGQALGRIDYQKLSNAPNTHVNVPVIAKSVDVSTTPTPNGTGGQAVILGDCTAANTECPASSPPTTHVLVQTTDVADNGAGQDQFRIMYLSCSGTPLPPTAFVEPSGCSQSLLMEGGLLSTGNIQVRLP